LQRDWNLDPQSLPFASHVRAHALVSLVQKGLLYHELEQTVDQARHTDLERIYKVCGQKWLTLNSTAWQSDGDYGSVLFFRARCGVQRQGARLSL
jgi:hypothetical protein